DILINFTIITIFNNLVVSVVALLLYYIILPYITNGITLGKLIVRIRIKGSRERVTFKEILKRNGILFFIISIQLVLSFIAPVFVVAYNLTILCYILYKTIKNDKILFYERISGTKNVIVCNEKDVLKEKNINLQKINSLNEVILHR
ncbi:RDD family protein, partial [Clostridium sporogenes]